jgi:hypothetical protein
VTAIFLLVLTSVLGGLSVPTIVFIAAKLGVCDPIDIELGTFLIHIAPWPLFDRSEAARQSVTTGSFAINAGGKQAFATTVAVTVFCTHVLLIEPAPFKAPDSSSLPKQDLTTGRFNSTHV